MACGPAPEQTYFFDLLDAAGPHPHAVRHPKIEADYEWRVGDPIPPGLVPPIESGGSPSYYPRGDGCDPEIAAQVWQAVLASIPSTVPEIPNPFMCVVETRRCDDGLLEACLVAHHDGGLSYVELRDGVLEWLDASGAGLLIWREKTHSWSRLPGKKYYDADKYAWLWKDASAHPVVEASEPEPPAPPDVAPEPAAPVVAPQPSGGVAAFLHAIHLATDVGWQKLADSLDRTTPGDVRNAVAKHIAAGSLSAGNAAALLALLDATEPPPEVAPENDDVDPVYGTRRPLPPPPGFVEDILRRKLAAHAKREEAQRPLRALVEAGLATWWGERCLLGAPGLMLWYDRNFGCPRDVTIWITDAGVDPEIVARIEGILGVRARGAATSLRLLEADPP